MPPTTIRAEIVRLITGSARYAVSETKGVSGVPIKSKPALQKAETEWKTAFHIPETPKSRQKTGSIQSAPMPSISRDVRITNPVSRTMPPTLGADMASCIRPRWDREMRRPDKSEKDAPTVITPRPPIWISTMRTA